MPSAPVPLLYPDCAPPPAADFCISGAPVRCRRNSYNEFEGGADQIACSACPTLSTSDEASNSSARCVCPVDYFANADATPTAGVSTNRSAADATSSGNAREASSEASTQFECLKAPAGVDASQPGAQLHSLSLLVGYWRISQDSPDVRRCPDAERGNASGCAGGRGDPCREGLQGVFCLDCVELNTHYSPLDSACHSCDNLSGRADVRIFFGVCVALALLLLLCTPFTSRLPRVSTRFSRRTAAEIAEGENMWEKAAIGITRLLQRLQGRIKIITSYYQVASSVSRSYQVLLPTSSAAVLDSAPCVSY